MAREIIRGDSYAIKRPLYVYTIVDENLNPFNLAGCTVRTTYRSTPASISEDPNDESAIWTGTLVVSSAGTETYSKGLSLQGLANEGKVEVRLSAEDSRKFPLDKELISDFEITDSLGEVFTFEFEEKLVAVEGVTHRLEG